MAFTVEDLIKVRDDPSSLGACGGSVWRFTRVSNDNKNVMFNFNYSTMQSVMLNSNATVEAGQLLDDLESRWKGEK